MNKMVILVLTILIILNTLSIYFISKRIDILSKSADMQFDVIEKISNSMLLESQVMKMFSERISALEKK